MTKRFLAFLLISSACALLVKPGFAQEESSSQADELKEKIAKLEKKLKELEGVESSLNKEISYLDTQINL
ncbi:MAG: hypothetical protein ABIH84_02870, partial [bacterium]